MVWTTVAGPCGDIRRTDESDNKNRSFRVNTAMLSRIKNSLVFWIEQVMVRSALSRFLFMMILIALVTLAAGVLVRPLFESMGDAVWWVFEHIVVPEYVEDDDDNVTKRAIATVLIILGSILFAGAIIAILVQWWDSTMERLELGLTPVALNDHFVLLGWTSRTLAMLEEIMVSRRRVERFLRERGARRLRVALLVERADTGRRQEIKQQLGEHWNPRQIVLRSGSSLRLEDLGRVDFKHAGAILIPAADTTTSSNLDADSRTSKTLMTLAAELEETLPEEAPLIVAEIQETQHIDTLRALYPGPMEIIAGDEVINRLMVQSVRHPGLSHVYAEFLSDSSGSHIYVRKESQLRGVSMQALAQAFPKGILLGVVRPQGDGFQALLNPPNDMTLDAGDRVAVLAASYDDSAPSTTVGLIAELSEREAPEAEMPGERRVLILGWNHRVPALMGEFASYPNERFSIDIVSQVTASKREKRIAVEEFPKSRLEIKQLEFDYTVPAFLESVDPAAYDNVVLVTSERLKPGSESDARVILGYLLLREIVGKEKGGPPVLVELSDPSNAELFQKRSGEILLSSLILSRMLARVALRRELRVVFDELFSSGGCEILFRRIGEYGSAGSIRQQNDLASTNGERTFADLERAADAQGEIAIGVRRSGQGRTPHGGVELNPKRDETMRLSDGDELIVLAAAES